MPSASANPLYLAYEPRVTDSRQRIYYSNNCFAPGFIDPSELPLLERAGALVR